MFKKLILFYLLGVTSAYASSAVELYPYNFEMRYERADSQEMVNRNPHSFSVAYVQERSKFLFDYSSFSENTGNFTSSIDRKHYEYVMWYQYSWYQANTQKIAWGIYNGIGAGAYEDNIVTKFVSETRADRSGYKTVGALSMGFKSAFVINPKYAVVSSLEGRLFMASDFDPNPNFGAILRLGLNIQI